MKHLMIILLALALATPAFAGEETGVYVKAIEGASGTFDEVVNQVKSGLSQAGFDIMASREEGAAEECGKRAHVIVFNNKEYAGKIMSHGPSAAFALPLKVGIYEDSEGINVAFANPASINRTVLGDDVEKDLSSFISNAINSAITTSVKGKAAGIQLGQIRSKGHVGGMGGGKFMKKIATFHEGGEYATVSGSVAKAIKANDKDWDLVYVTEPAEGVMLIGVSKAATEAKAFGIAGDRRRSKTEPCPGLDHAAAFPIEVVVYTRDGKAAVVSLDEMYRMKLYFEDAGNWAFMKNMTMPGNIQDEIEEVVTSGLKKQ